MGEAVRAGRSLNHYTQNRHVAGTAEAIRIVRPGEAVAPWSWARLARCDPMDPQPVIGYFRGLSSW